MSSRVVDAKMVLADIRSGISDNDLMSKYGLSTRGLQSLFGKLQSAGLLKCLAGADVAKDVRAGLSRDQLMRKYELSEGALEFLFREIDRTGLLRHPSEKDEPRSALLINVPEIVNDIRARMDRVELLKKYRLSSRGLRWVTMTLITSGSISWEEVYGTICSTYDELVPERLRTSVRHPVDFLVPVCDVNRPDVLGMLRDISETGIGARGIQAEVGEMKTLVISADEFGEYSAVVLDAECRWASAHPLKNRLAGFEIRHMSVGSMAEFRILIKLARLRCQSKPPFTNGLLNGYDYRRSGPQSPQDDPPIEMRAMLSQGTFASPSVASQ